ncbi:unnamed protein product [Alternaria alternata]
MDSKTGELEDLKRIVTLLRSGTDDRAAAILARLRLGEPLEDVAKTLVTAPPVVSGQSPSLLGQKCADTSGSGMSYELTFDLSQAGYLRQRQTKRS